jgi:flagellar biosynthesis component FlhA
LIGFVPGMPNFLFLAAAAIAGLAGFLMRKREQGESDLRSAATAWRRSTA